MIVEVCWRVWERKTEFVNITFFSLKRKQMTWAGSRDVLKNKLDWDSCIRRKDETSIDLTLSNQMIIQWSSWWTWKVNLKD